MMYEMAGATQRAVLAMACAVLAGSGLVGCQAASPQPGARGGSSGQGAAGTFGVAGTTAGTGGGFAGVGDLGGAGAVSGAGTGGTNAADGGMTSAGRATSGSTPLPCDVNTILKTSCQSCHAATPLSGVPMALVSWEDTQKPSVSNPSMTVHQMMKTRVHSMMMPMPPPPSMTLGATDLAALDAWLDGGAIAGTDPSCKPAMPPTMAPADTEHCYEIHAHANSIPGDTAPLQVSGEHYAWFYFDAPWPDGAQGVYFETLGGAHPELIHHWLIYAEDNTTPPLGCTSPQPDGTVVYPVSNGNHCSSPTLVAGWAPGANNNELPSNVGMQLSGKNRKMSMEIHFFNKTGNTLPSDAGVKICTVEKNLRPNTATISWLGTEGGINIPPMAQDSTATGTCTPQFNGDIHVIRSWPHMHLLGRKMESMILRKDGTTEMVSPAGGWSFDFNSEVSWKTEYVVHPGDKVKTVCHYTNTTNNTVQVGFENKFEMCFDFTLAYPAGALVNKNWAGGSTSLTGSSTACEM
jgi:hypothetical protein